MGVVSFSQAQQIAEIARVWHFCRFAKQHVEFFWLWIDAWAQICLLNLYNVDWHLERRYGRVRCEVSYRPVGASPLKRGEYSEFVKQNGGTTNAIFGPHESTEIFGKFFDSDASVSRWKIFLVLDVSLVVKQILDRFLWWCGGLGDLPREMEDKS